LAVPDDGEENSGNLRVLAQEVWTERWYAKARMVDGSYISIFRQAWDRPKLEVTREAIPIILERYRQMKSRIAEYVARPEVVEFMENADPPSNNPEQVVTRRHVVETIYRDTDRHRLVFSRNYELLLARQRQIFDNPQQYHHLFRDLLDG